MYTNDDITNLVGFIKQTPEGSLRKMMVQGPLTEAHFRILMKLAKGGPEADFVDAFQNESMGKLRLSTKEAPMKETFWNICKGQFQIMGLLTKNAA
jgi:hypothetical protein